MLCCPAPGLQAVQPQACSPAVCLQGVQLPVGSERFTYMRTVVEAQVEGDGGGQQGGESALLQLVLEDGGVAPAAAAGWQEVSRQ